MGSVRVEPHCDDATRSCIQTIQRQQANMSTNRASTANGAHPAPEKTYFEQQREMLVGEIAQVNPPPRRFSYTPLHTALHAIGASD